MSMATEAAILILLEQRWPEWVSVEDVCAFVALDDAAVRVHLLALYCQHRIALHTVSDQNLHIVAASHIEQEAGPCA